MKPSIHEQPIISERADTCTDVIETVEFTDISAKIIGKLSPKEIFPILEVIATEWGLNLSFAKQSKTAEKILINSIKYN